jgi:adenylosuccinate synthase
MQYLDMIIDCQFGSTGKGLIAGYLAKKYRPDTIVTSWAPNAGHTFIDADGRKFIHTMLANGIVSPGLKRVMIGPGSLINPEALMRELRECSDLVSIDQLIIHPNAAVVMQSHIDEEAGPMTKIGSTKKGAGAAAIQRIRRDPDKMNVASHALEGPLARRVVSVQDWISILLEDAMHVQIEGAQGYSLSMYNGFYPYCTSRDVSKWQLLADAGIPADAMAPANINVVGTCRTFPIRVANRYNESGEQVGWSGPYYDDQEETSFEDIGQKTELTTVTKLPRRIFTYSKQQMEQAIRYNGVNEVFLNFANYANDEQMADILDHLNSLSYVRWLGFGPTEKDVKDISDV